MVLREYVYSQLLLVVLLYHSNRKIINTLRIWGLAQSALTKQIPKLLHYVAFSPMNQHLEGCELTDGESLQISKASSYSPAFFSP